MTTIKFDYNGRNYKVVNGMVHTADNGILDPCYKGDNVMLDDYAEILGFKTYQRPNGIHTHGHQKGEARKYPVSNDDAFKPNAMLD